MPVNLANVNISLRQFQEISSGQYNAGEVNLTSSTTLGKINNFVHRTGKNNVSLSHAEVLAIKDAFVRALSQSGVSANEINRIRFELGLAPGGATDTALVARSIRPLSRQQIRVILDRNKDAINEHVGPGTIRTHAEVHARYSSLMRAGFAQTRRDVYNATMHMRQTIPDRNIVDAQAILAGDVRFSSPEERERLIAAAERQKAVLLERSQGNRSDDPNATLAFHRAADGFRVTFALGMSEKDYVRKLDDILLFLHLHTQPIDRNGPIPALLPAEANGNMLTVLTGGAAGRPTCETEAVQTGVRREFEARFGTGVFKANAPFSTFAPSSVVTRALNSLGDMADVRFTVEQIKAAIVAEAAPDVAKLFLSKALAPMLKAAGGISGSSVGLASDLFVRYPQLKARLIAAQSLEQSRAVLAEFTPEIEGGIRRQIEADRCREQAKVWYREKIATEMGVPVSALEGRGVLNLKRLSVKCTSLGTDIGSGRNAASSNQQIEQCFRGLANVSANVRINLMRQVDALDIPADARDILKHQILTLEKVTGFNLASFKEMADEIPVDALLLAISSDAPVDKVLAEMGVIGQRVEGAAIDILADPGAGGDDVGAVANLLVTLALAKRPEALDLVRAFFARPDVADVSLVNLKGPASRAVAFQMFKPEIPTAESNAELADAIGKPGLASLHAQALNLAFDDLGLGNLSADEKANLLSSDAGNSLLRQVRAAPHPVTPSQLRALVRMAFAGAAALAHAESILVELSKAAGSEISATSAAQAMGVISKRSSDLASKLKTAVSRAATMGENPRTAVEMVLTVHTDVAMAAISSFHAIEAVNATAVDTAVREIAARANLPVEFVRGKLDTSGLVLGGGSLDFLLGDIRDQLAKPATDVAAWDAKSVEDAAKARVESFIAKKVAFIAEVAQMPISQAARGALLDETLSYPPYKDPDLAAAASRILQRPEIRAALDYAKNTLVPEKVAQISDEDLFFVFETVGQHLNAAIEAELPEAKRAQMDNDDHAVIRSLLVFAFTDHCGQTLLDASARLAAGGRLDTIDQAGNAARRRYDDEYMTYASGYNSKGQEVKKDEAKALAANKGAADVSLGQRLLAGLTVTLQDEWLPAELADAVRLSEATSMQKAIAEAALKHVPGLVERLGEGLDPAKLARFKSFAITLDYRDNARAASEAVLRDAAKALREAEDTQEGAAKAEAKLKELAESLFKAQDAAGFVASAAQMSGVALNEAQSAKATALLTEFAAGMPVKNARVLARFIVNLSLTDESAEIDRSRVQILAPQLAGWREFGLDGTGKQQVTDFFRDEANDLILDYEKPGKKELQYMNDISKSMRADVNRGHYTIAGKRFSMRPAAEVLEAFGKIVTVPKAKRALTILMSQASALPVLSMQMKFTVPPNDHRPQPLDTATLAGSSEFVARGMTDPQLFMAQQIVDDVTSIFDLSVSEDGATATLKIVKSANLAVGTEESKMNTYFGSVVVEEEVTVDLTAEVPTVTNVRVAQRFDDSSDLQARYLAETEPIPAPPPFRGRRRFRTFPPCERPCRNEHEDNFVCFRYWEIRRLGVSEEIIKILQAS